MPLAVCATPIGNLEDVTLRVLHELAAADVVLCEDTRQTRGLLDRHGIKARLLSYHQHNEARRDRRAAAAARRRRADRARLRRRPARGQRPGRAADRGRARGGCPGDRAAGSVGGRDGARRERARRASSYRFLGYLPRGEKALGALWEELASLAASGRRVRVAAAAPGDARDRSRPRCPSVRSRSAAS